MIINYSICANYLTKAHVPIQKEVNTIIANVIKNDIQLIDGRRFY